MPAGPRFIAVPHPFDSPNMVQAFRLRAFPGLLAGLLAAVITAAHGAAPVEERGHRSDPIEDAQQRLEQTRRDMNAADAQVQQAERSAREADAALAAVQKQYDEARARREAAHKQVADARARRVAATKAHERESAEFERLRRADGAKAAKKS